MRIVLGTICVLFGLLGWVGQFLSSVNFPLAQRLGLQEKGEGTDALFRLVELNGARWDSVVLWTLPAVGILMLLDHAWWPCLALVAGGIHIDTGGREAAKYLGLFRSGVRVGDAGDRKKAYGTYLFLTGIGLWLTAYAILFIS